ncbi:MAG TPA: hypothetical protein VFR10_13090 [bacterium]|nr:hypothetical protein [bacterium]
MRSAEVSQAGVDLVIPVDESVAAGAFMAVESADAEGFVDSRVVHEESESQRMERQKLAIVLRISFPPGMTSATS